MQIQSPWFVRILLALTTAGCIGEIDAGMPGRGRGGGGTGGGMVDPGQPPTTQPPGGSEMKPPPPAERPAPGAVPTTRYARLSHRQWENTVRDLLRLPAVPGLAVKFTSDSAGKFANDGESLAVPDSLRIDYQTAAETLAVRVARDPAAVARLLPASAPAEAKGRALAFIRELGRRAYRRPLDDQEVTAFATLFDQAGTLVPGVEPFAGGVQLVIEAMLQSHHFLYRAERTTGSGRVRLDGHEIAAKLSFALANTMPDEPLFAAAASGQLRTNDQVVAQAERLLGTTAGPGATFHEALYGLANLDLEKDGRAFPEFKPAWQASIVKESELYLAEIVSSGRGLADLLTSPFTFVDATLAPLYGVAAPAGGGFVRVELDRTKRAGFLTQIAFLARDGLTEPEPIRRGAFVNHAILCLDLVPPPGATDDTPAPPASARTNRERTTAITRGAVCEACHHGMINPAGFAFENYDALGRYRTTENGVPIDAADSYAFASGPKRFENAVEFSRLLAESPEAHACYARSWFTYLHGRPVRTADEPFVTWLAGRSLAQRASVRSLALTIVTDDSFLTRLP